MRLFIPLALMLTALAPAQSINRNDVQALAHVGNTFVFLMPDASLVFANNPSWGTNTIDLSGGYSTCTHGGSSGVWILPNQGQVEDPEQGVIRTTWIDIYGNSHTLTSVPTERELGSRTLYRQFVERHAWQLNMLQSAFPPCPARHQ